MRASLNFTLPEDQAAFDAALLGRRAIATLRKIDNRLRARTKYEVSTPDVTEIADEVRGMIDEIFFSVDG